jgi:hypothetical protein
MGTPAAKREAVAYLRISFKVSERRACTVPGVDRTSIRCAAVDRVMSVYDCTCANWRLSVAGSAIAAYTS